MLKKQIAQIVRIKRNVESGTSYILRVNEKNLIKSDWKEIKMPGYTENIDRAHGCPRLPSLPGRLSIVEKIMSDAIRDEQVRRYRPRAQFTFFCGEEPELLAGRDGQLELVGRCLEWFVFDYVIPELCQTPAQNWFSRNSHKLSLEARHDAADCLNYQISVFEIIEVHPISGFVAIDLLRNGKAYFVDEHVINDQIEPGQMLLGRLFPHKDNYSLSGMATIMDSQACKQVRNLIKSGKLKTETMLEDLDGLELENLYGRSLMRLDRLSMDNLTARLTRYLEVSGSEINIETLNEFVAKAEDPVEAAVKFCRKANIECRHEIELMIAYIMNYWFKLQNY